MICNFIVANNGIWIDCKSGFRNAFNLDVPQGKWAVRMFDATGLGISRSLETIAEGGCIAVPESDAVTIQLLKE